MSNEKGYNGYTNYETWVCSLWIDNDESTQDFYNEMAKACLKYNNEKDNAIYEMQARIKSEIEENNPIQNASMYSDLMNAAISEINFYEIAENFINEAIENNKD